MPASDMDCFNGWFYDHQNHFQGNLAQPFFCCFRFGPWLPPFQQAGITTRNPPKQTHGFHDEPTHLKALEIMRWDDDLPLMFW